MNVAPAILTATADTSGVSADFLDGLADVLEKKPVSLNEFFVGAWNVVEPNRQLVRNWHVDLIVEYLEAVAAGQIKRLIFNIPPRSLKSNLISIAWPVWAWTHMPWLRFIFASYSATLSVKHSLDRRRILESGWFKERWGDIARLEEDQNQKTEYQNTQRGAMVSTSVGGSITGKGGDIIVIDDLINPEDAESKPKRDAALDFYRFTLSTRLDDRDKGAMVIVEQRLHTQDLTANALKEAGWTHVSIPYEAPANTTILFPGSGRVYERPAGELLNPTRDKAAHIPEILSRISSRGFKAQYQQEPISKEGGFLQYGWWKFYRRADAEALPFDMKPIEEDSVWYWDIAAKAKETNDYSSGFRIAKIGRMYRVTNWIKKRFEYPEMKRRIEMEYVAHPAGRVMVEDASSGQAVIQDFRAGASPVPVIGVPVTQDKVTRVKVISGLVESGVVELPEDDPQTLDFMDQCAGFPNIEFDDDVDAFTGALTEISGRGKRGMAGLYVIAGEMEEG